MSVTLACLFERYLYFICFSDERGFSAMEQNPEFMAAIGKSFASQTATLSKMVDTEEEDEGLTFECSSCNLVQTEENMSCTDNSCPHCGSTMYRNRNYR